MAMLTIRSTLLALACTAAPLAGSASAATFQVFDALDTRLGTFEAPAAGGQLSTASFEIGGIVFDGIDPADVPEFRPAFNDLTGPGATIFANFFNTAAAGSCGAGDCALFFEKINPGPPDVFTFAAFDTITFEQLGGGNYRVAPIPLPATGLLMAAALLGAAALRSAAARRGPRTERTL